MGAFKGPLEQSGTGTFWLWQIFPAILSKVLHGYIINSTAFHLGCCIDKAWKQGFFSSFFLVKGKDAFGTKLRNRKAFRRENSLFVKCRLSVCIDGADITLLILLTECNCSVFCIVCTDCCYAVGILLCCMVHALLQRNWLSVCWLKLRITRTKACDLD